MKRVTFRYSAGGCFILAALIYLVSCQTGTYVPPVSQAQQDSLQVHVMDDGDIKKPGGPGCCQ